MTSMTFYARGDSASANNGSLNAQGTNTTPTTELVFTSGPTGDIVLDYNNGAQDPDTTVLVDGVEMNFTVEFSGLLPSTNKLSNVNGEDLRGEEIVVVTTEDGQRYFFLTNGTTSLATMDDFPNGAHAIEGVVSGTDVLICFLRGTYIRTPKGEVPVETLRAGDLVTNSKGKQIALRWVSSRKLSPTNLMLEPKYRPIRVPEGSFGNNKPFADLWLSPLHRIVVRGWEVELYFGEVEVFAATKHVVQNQTTSRSARFRNIEYFHLLFDQHDVVLANGLETESLFPGDTAIASLTEDERNKLDQILEEQGHSIDNYGSTALPTVTKHEAHLLKRSVIQSDDLSQSVGDQKLIAA
ncbi:Hint domain-containing protein [Pseudohalocynthiibacter sp. F2068]|uniref:Hint domain-containing protein n=1 Tax=Pseudohalocynthiibacter sp. F2068 TaxID=2926418 RepID=UPI001FF45E4C|nr:Hint domain-containing protein [Pseudohalocynthiibacter sp. F2068]MCK0101817.1 Hint domain-containing protein [Pseudohalocynthiibacter sp. F2068]